MTGRLDKLLAACALISRTEAQSALRAGRVTVDGSVCRDGAAKYATEKNTILLNGQRVEGDGFVYLMLNKPTGVLSATEDKRGETTALDFLPEKYQKAGLGVVGRLDKDAHGLLFLTSNGQLNHRLTSPRRHADKVYRVALDIPAGEEDGKAFAEGMDLGDFTALPAALELFGDGRVCRVTLREGKFHQIKRMFARQGKTVVDLQRLSIGPLVLDPALDLGDFRPLTGEEIRALLAAADMM